MKKIVLSVLSVAGLLAALLVLAGGSVSAETGLVRVESTNVRGGTYGLSWKAKAGCDSSADGSVSKVVPPNAPNANQRIVGSLTTNDNCQYDFTATYVTGVNSGVPGNVPVGTRCAATTTVQNLDGDPSTAFQVIIETSDTDCVLKSEIPVKIRGPADDGNVDNSYHRNAVNARTWTITLTPTGKGADGNENTAADECVALTVDDARVPAGGTEVEGRFNIITAGLDKDGVATSCSYDARVTIQPGFEEVSKDSSVVKGVRCCGFGGPAADLYLKVSRREVFVVQNVSGDASGAKVSYSTQLSCTDADNPPLDLPPEVGVTGTRDGIETVQGKTLVPLTTGRYDVSEGIAGSMDSSVTGTTGRKAVRAFAVASDGDNCSLSISVKDVPASCTVASSSQTVNLLTAENRNIVEFSFRCTAPTPTTVAPPTTAAPATTAGPPPPETPTTAVPSSEDAPPPASGGNELSDVDVVTTTTGMVDMPTTTMAPKGPPVESPTGLQAGETGVEADEVF